MTDLLRQRLWSHASATRPPSQGEGKDGFGESTHDRDALPIGKRPPTKHSEKGRLSVRETFCNTWTPFFWRLRQPLHCNITASVWIVVVGASRSCPSPAVPTGRRGGKGKQKFPPDGSFLSSVFPAPHSRPNSVVFLTHVQGYDQGPPCSPSAYPRTVFRIISVSSSLTLLL